MKYLMANKIILLDFMANKTYCRLLEHFNMCFIFAAALIFHLSGLIHAQIIVHFEILEICRSFHIH